MRRVQECEAVIEANTDLSKSASAAGSWPRSLESQKQTQDFFRRIRFESRAAGHSLVWRPDGCCQASADLEGTRVKLLQATAQDKALGDEMKELNENLLRYQKECEAAVEANTDLSQQLERSKGELSLKT